MISREKLIALYSAMVKYRALAAQTKGKVPASWRLTPGLEPTVAAITADLRRDDSFVATQGKLASAFIPRSSWKDDLQAGLSSTHAKNGRISSMTLAKEFASSLASADALKTTRGNAVALLLCETRIPAVLWRKQLQRASRSNLPIVFVRITTPSRRAHTAPPAFAFGVPRIAVDAHDVLAVYRVASESVARARHRRGPTLIECVDFTDAINAENSSESDPIQAMERHLAKKRILNAALKQKIAAGITRELNRTAAALLT